MAYDEGSPDEWIKMYNDTVGPDTPVFATLGNHEVFDEADHAAADGWTLNQSITTIFANSGVRRFCRGYTGVNMVCTFRGVTIVIVAPGVEPLSNVTSQHVEFIDQSFRQYSQSRWRVCVWHLDMHLMQIGNEEDASGWGVYEMCRRHGAMVVTAHEHLYCRTFTMSSFEFQRTVSTSHAEPLVLQAESRRGETVGTSFVALVGTGGRNIRGGVDALQENPWWAAALSNSSVPPLNFGALICRFKCSGVANRSCCHFMQMDNVTRDEFVIITAIPSPTDDQFTLLADPVAVIAFGVISAGCFVAAAVYYCRRLRRQSADYHLAGSANGAEEQAMPLSDTHFSVNLE